MKFIGEIAEGSIKQKTRHGAEFPSAQSDAFTGSDAKKRSRPAPLGMTGVMEFFPVKFMSRLKPRPTNLCATKLRHTNLG